MTSTPEIGIQHYVIHTPDLLNAWQATVIKGNHAEIGTLVNSAEVNQSRESTEKKSYLTLVSRYQLKVSIR